MSVLQDLYNSEINASVSWFWDGGIEVSLGDPMNGWDAETNKDNWEDAERWLAETACRIYPDSDFAKQRKQAA